MLEEESVIGHVSNWMLWDGQRLPPSLSHKQPCGPGSLTRAGGSETRLHTDPPPHKVCGNPSQTGSFTPATIRAVDSESLVRALQDFLATSRDAVVLEDGSISFDLSCAKYSVSGEHGKCLLHLWSAERNIVRRVMDAEVRNGVLRLTVQRMGQTRPSKLEICRERDHRTPSARKTARSAYQRRLQRVLERTCPGFSVPRLSTAMDLEHSFGPIYARGLLHKGRSAFAVFGVNQDETQASIDAALSFAILWLDGCRHSHEGKVLVEGLKLFLPSGCSALTRERIAHLNAGAAKWQLFEFEEKDESLREIDCSDRGNIATRLVHCPNENAARERFADSVRYIRELIPEAEATVLSGAEIAFRLHGLEFARARLGHAPDSFRSKQEIVFGIGAEERVLDEKNAPDFVSLIRSVGEVRHPEGPRDHPLFRLHPERWLESLVIKDIAAVDERLAPTDVYSQVPAFSASDRAMIDVLTTTRDGRLAVIELKAGEDIHLPLQGLDYWCRVNWHHVRGEFQRFGYFPDRELSSEPPLLFLVAPALHVHPATDTLLHYISPEVQWTLLGIDERWRTGVRVIFRKHANRLQTPDSSLRSKRQGQE